jgi:serine phosphatase RsbU (regulator of sigma subunit)
MLVGGVDARAAEVIIHPNDKHINLNLPIEVFVDTHASLPPKHVMADDFNNWRTFAGQAPNFGLTQSAIWLKFGLRNQSNQPLKRILEIKHNLLDKIDLYYDTTGKLVHVKSGRDRVPNAELSALGFVFKIELPKQESKTFFIRLRSTDGIQVPISLWQEDAFIRENHKMLIIECLYFGIVLMMCIYNLFLSFRLHNLNYLYYVLYAASCGAVFFMIQGFPFMFYWAENTRLYRVIFLVGQHLIFSSALLFTAEFLQFRKNLPELKLWMKLAWVLLGISFIASFIIPYYFALQIALPGYIACILIVIYSTSKMALFGRRMFQFFFVAWCFPVVGVIVTMLSLLGVIEPVVHTLLPAQLGSVAELILLSLALAERLNELQRTKLKAQRELESTKKAHNEAQRVQRKLLKPDPQTWWLQTASHYQPAALTSGDWLGGFHDQKNDRVFYFLGDVSGHGFSAGIVTAAIAGSIQMLTDCQAIQTMKSDEILNCFAHETNKVVSRIAKSSGHLMSMVSLVLDYKNRRCYYLNAGHTAIFRVVENEVRPIAKAGSLLGLSADPEFGQRQVAWCNGQMFLLYTDGLIENHGHNQRVLKPREIRNILQHCQSPEEVIKRLKETTHALWGVETVEDDVAIVALQLKAS